MVNIVPIIDNFELFRKFLVSFLTIFEMVVTQFEQNTSQITHSLSVA